MPSKSSYNLFTCQPGFEALLSKELFLHGCKTQQSGRGWIATDVTTTADLCFAHLQLVHVETIEGTSVNAQAARLVDVFMDRIRGIALPVGWPLIFRFADGVTGLGQRVKVVEKEFRARFEKHMARLNRTARGELSRRGGDLSGLFVYFPGFDRLYATTEAWSGGQCRMADDPKAPSRSYLKTEEAFAIMGREPVAGQKVVDLGAAPGGWSYSAAKRGAMVLAIDNGPMKGGAKNHPLIQHVRNDAFKFMPQPDECFDWLLCDLVEEPYRVLRLVERWLKGGRCRNFVVNLKFGRANALSLLNDALAPKGRLHPYCATLQIRHLFHDRDEFTLMGRSNPA